MITTPICLAVMSGIYSLFPFSVEGKPVITGAQIPSHIDVSLTYRGQKRIYLSPGTYHKPCFYRLPDPWKPTRQPQSDMMLSIGFGLALLSPGDQISYRIEMKEYYNYTPTPGRSVIRVYPAVTVLSDNRKIVGHLLGKPVDVPVWIGNDIARKSRTVR